MHTYLNHMTGRLLWQTASAVQELRDLSFLCLQRCRLAYVRQKVLKQQTYPLNSINISCNWSNLCKQPGTWSVIPSNLVSDFAQIVIVRPMIFNPSLHYTPLQRPRSAAPGGAVWYGSFYAPQIYYLGAYSNHTVCVQVCLLSVCLSIIVSGA